MSAFSTSLTIPSRIVVRGTNWVGDTVMSLPALKELRRIFPSSTLAVWVPEGLSDLVRATGIADEVVTFTPRFGGPARRAFTMRKPLRRGRFGMAVLFQNAFESAFTAWLAGIPIRAGYPTDLRRPMLNLVAPRTEEIRAKHQVFYYLAITDYLEARFYGEAHRADPTPPDCSILLPPEKLNGAARLLREFGADLNRPLFSLCPGSVNSEAKRWPADYFARLADLLTERFNGEIAFLGAPTETDLISGIQSMMRRARGMNLARRADIITSMGVMNLSRMVVSNDTGSAHLAVAADAPVLTLFGPTIAGATAPYGGHAHVIEGRASCAPCRHFRCPLPDHPCMRSISPDETVNAIEEILSGSYPQATAGGDAAR